MAYVHRHTLWQTTDGAVAQVECCVLNSDDWDALAAVVELVPENGDATGCLVIACGHAVNLARGQHRGQTSMPF
jgi:hypothetical protein